MLKFENPCCFHATVFGAAVIAFLSFFTPVIGIRTDDIAAAADKVKNGGILSLMVERNGQTVPIGVNVTGS